MATEELGRTSHEQFAKMQRAVSIIRQIGRAWDHVAAHEAAQLDKPKSERQSAPDDLLKRAEDATRLGDLALGIEPKTT